MEGLGELFSGLFPLLFSGAVVGALLSYLTPALIKILRDNFRRTRIMQLYNIFQNNPQRLAKSNEPLYKFFDERGWHTCACDNCKWFRKKMSVNEPTAEETVHPEGSEASE